MSHLDSLNPRQKEAVLLTSGPLLVLAGAGAGKTRVIAHRILEIIRRGTSPREILAITFTNKAAAEMRERVLKLLAESPKLSRPVFAKDSSPYVATFHALGLSIIKEQYRAFGFKRLPVVYDRADSLRAMKAALKSVGAEGVEPRAALSVMSRLKGEGGTAADFGGSATNERERSIAAAWSAYTRELKAEQALDFDDLLLRTVLFLEEREDMRDTYRARWKYVHVDEYQDTNAIQARLMKLLVGPEGHICAVGDIDQTIYTWRGAQIANILSFAKEFTGAKTIILEENYRSTKNILAAANDIIGKNVCRVEKNMFTHNVDGEALSLYQAYDEADEALFVARKIKRLMENGRLPACAGRPRDFAVLYRANFQSRALEEALLSAGIPYQVLGTRFFERAEVKDILSFIRAAVAETSADIARIANTPARGIGKTTLLAMLSAKPSLKDGRPTARLSEQFRGSKGEKVAGFYALLSRIRASAENLRPSELIAYVSRETGMEREYTTDKAGGAERLENIRELGVLAGRYDGAPVPEGLQSFLESAALASDQDELKETTNAVRLMTVHASKGLEFPYVFITGLEEGLFPYLREGEEPEDKEEERRLMYVAVTRAQKKVFLSFAGARSVFGSRGCTEPSQFLSDISSAYLTLETPERIGKTIYLD